MADVVVAGRGMVEPALAVHALVERGYRRISCEGGPRLLGHLVVADRLDELCLTRSPVMVAGRSPRISNGPAPSVPLQMRLGHLLAEGDYLFERYVRA